jgi:hypothetical protein
VAVTATREEALRTIEELERLHNYKIDAILPDGTHRYWSTHCRHTPVDDLTASGHLDCAATELTGPLHVGPRDSHTRRYAVSETRIPRDPAQCKTCAAPCVCPCHRGEIAVGGD